MIFGFQLCVTRQLLVFLICELFGPKYKLGCHQIGCGWIHQRSSLSGWALRQKKMGMEVIVEALPGWKPKNIVWDHCTLLNEGLLIVDHINCICKSSFYQLHQIVVIPQNLIHDSIVTVIHTFTIKRHDYCNAVLTGLSKFKFPRFSPSLTGLPRLWQKFSNF